MKRPNILSFAVFSCLFQVWDKVLETFATESATENAINCVMKHQYKGHGENIYKGYETDEKKIVMKWFMERNIYNFTTYKCHPNNEQETCGHYLQVIDFQIQN